MTVSWIVPLSDCRLWYGINQSINQKADPQTNRNAATSPCNGETVPDPIVPNWGFK